MIESDVVGQQHLVDQLQRDIDTEPAGGDGSKPGDVAGSWCAPQRSVWPEVSLDAAGELVVQSGVFLGPSVEVHALVSSVLERAQGVRRKHDRHGRTGRPVGNFARVRRE